MEFEYQLLTNRDGPLAKHEVKDLSELNHYMEIMHDDFQLPGEDGGDGVRWHVNDSRRIHVYERCSQLSILQQLPQLICGPPHAPAGAGPVPSGAQNAPPSVRSCGTCWSTPTTARSGPEEQAFIDLLHREAALTVK